MFDVITMVPLLPSKVVKLEEKALGPLLAGSLATLGVVIPLLDLPPFGREQAFQHIFPTDGSLGLHSLRDVCVTKVGMREL